MVGDDEFVMKTALHESAGLENLNRLGICVSWERTEIKAVPQWCTDETRRRSTTAHLPRSMAHHTHNTQTVIRVQHTIDTATDHTHIITHMGYPCCILVGSHLLHCCGEATSTPLLVSCVVSCHVVSCRVVSGDCSAHLSHVADLSPPTYTHTTPRHTHHIPIPRSTTPLHHPTTSYRHYRSISIPTIRSHELCRSLLLTLFPFYAVVVSRFLLATHTPPLAIMSLLASTQNKVLGAVGVGAAAYYLWNQVRNIHHTCA